MWVSCPSGWKSKVTVSVQWLPSAAEGDSGPGPLQLRCLAGICGAWTRGSITSSAPSPWRLPASVCLQSSSFIGHQSYWMGTRPLQGSLSFIRSSHGRLVSKQATCPGAWGSVFNTSLGEQAQPQGED